MEDELEDKGKRATRSSDAETSLYYYWLHWGYEECSGMITAFVNLASDKLKKTDVILILKMFQRSASCKKTGKTTQMCYKIDVRKQEYLYNLRNKPKTLNSEAQSFFL